MLTLLHPELMPTILAFPLGFRALTIKGHARPVLVFKGPKEALLAAQLRKGFKMYVAPLIVGESATAGIVSAFFDDDDEPLTVRTPLFGDRESVSLKEAILGGALDVYLFDENDRELLGYASSLRIPPATRRHMEQMHLLPLSYPAARAAHDQMTDWFAQRRAADDAAAIAVDFGEALFPENMVILDHRPEHHAFHGGRGHSHATLVRSEPGRFQEHDIVRLLQRIFRPEQIYLGPLRTTDKEEVADVIVITDTRMLLVQAKDSPNTEQVLRNTIERKKATALKSLKKAIEQVKGAVRYARAHSPMRILVNDAELIVPIDHLELTSLIVLKEMFDDQYRAYSHPLLQLAEKTKVSCLALDYSELNMYTAHLDGEEAFFDAYNRVFRVGLERGEFPRLRIWPGGL
jgi:hypothetical protein